MNLPKINTPERYVGLYVIDFGDQCGVGYTAEEVAELLESEKYADVKVYKIHRARPDGTMELVGIPREKFFLESGMFFHCLDEKRGRDDFRRLREWGDTQAPPCRAKLHLIRGEEGQWLVGLIYPAEYEQEMGVWLKESGFRSGGAVDAGVSQVQRYYQNSFEVLERSQLWPAESRRARDIEELLGSVGVAIQR